MSEIFFTSDTHFGHYNIIKYCSRPYVNEEEMNEGLISNWNSAISSKDIVYHLGDVLFKSIDYSLLKRLNGKVTLIPGNHDSVHKNQTYEVLDWGDWEISSEILVLKKMKLVLCHYPIYSWPHKHHGWIHLHGHTHGAKEYDPMAVDVGVDSWNMFPTNLYDIKERIKKR